MRIDVLCRLDSGVDHRRWGTARSDPMATTGSARAFFQRLSQTVPKGATWRTLVIVASIILLTWYDPANAALPGMPPDISVFTINEFDNDPNAPALSALVDSQNWVRAWFKWNRAPELAGKGALVDLAHRSGALFGGGVTCSALYRGENGLSEAEFMDFATRDPYGNLYQVSHSYYHGSIANPAYLRYVLKWALQQVDAGVDTLFMDEFNAAYSVHEGYDQYSLAAFRQYLLDRFVRKQHWSETDPRWKTNFRVNLADPAECPDHTIRSFDYAAYLRLNGWADNPEQGANPMAPVWDLPNDITDEEITEDSYCAARDRAAWDFWATQIRSYAERLGRHVWLAANGLITGVDYQIIGVFRDFPRTSDGGLSCVDSYLGDWRAVYERSRVLMNGRDVPIVAFHDWDEGMPWQRLSPAERVAWLKAYAPEVFAAGIFFAYPVHGPFGPDVRTDGTLPVIQQQARFVKSIAPLLHGLEWQDPGTAAFSGKAEVTIQGQLDARRLVVHLVNRDYEGLTPRLQRGTLRVALPSRPTRVSVQSVESQQAETVPWRYDQRSTLRGRTSAGVLEVPIPALETWDVVEVDLRKWTDLPLSSDSATVRCPLIWGRPDQSQFLVSAKIVDDLPGLRGYVQGQAHPELRNNPTFSVRFRRPGRFDVHVNSVARAGARLVVQVDGKAALVAAIPDRDKRNDGNAHEIDQTFSIDVRAGQHSISVINEGGDWFTVDWYRFEGF